MFEGLITKEEAINLLFNKWDYRTEKEEIDVIDACGRTLAEDYFAQYNQPVVRASAMDGVAVKSAAFENGMPDTSAWVEGVDYVRADTGDDFDDAYDSVVKIEDVKFYSANGLVFVDDFQFKAGMNVRPAGSNIKAGAQVGKAGTVLAPGHLAALVSGGYSRVQVYKKPVIAFIPTGSELVAAGSVLQRGQNFDSNSIMVKCFLEEIGAKVILHPIVKDKKNDVKNALDSMIEQADVVILNAGTSKGSEDYCIQYLTENGELLFHGVKAVPGRPMSIAMYKNKPVINMSGPAVAALNGCIWLMCPIVERMLSQREKLYLPAEEAVLTEEVKAPPFISAFKGVMLSRDSEGILYATPIEGRGPKAQPMSASLSADGYFMTEVGKAGMNAGDRIKVFLAK